MRTIHWLDLTSEDFTKLDPARTVAVLPVAAVEQHGPHLPVATDTAIAEGMIATVKPLVPDDLPVLFLPVQAVGKSNEHIRSPGTLTFSAETVLRAWTEIGESVARAGVAQARLRQFARRQCRDPRHRGARAAHPLPDAVRADAVAPPRSSARHVRRGRDHHGIHAGDIETSLMLHFRPDR